MMNKTLTIAILSLLLAVNSYCASFQYQQRIVNYSEGLSNLNIKAIHQDKLGFMWFGTKNKLNRFDGVTIRTFDCFDKKKNKRENSINTIAEATNYILWIGTDNGVYLFNIETENFTFFDLKTNNGISIDQWVAEIWIDNDQNVWIVVPNQGLFRYNMTKKTLQLYEVVDKFKQGLNFPSCMTIDDSERIWIGTSSSGVYQYDKQKDTFKQYLGNKGKETLENKAIYSISSNKNQIIIGEHEKSLLVLDPLMNIVQTVSIPKIDNAIIRHIAVYNEQLWVSTQKGLYSLGFKNRTIDKESIITHKVDDNYIERTYQDKEGGIWIATKYNGINFIPNYTDFFEVFIPKQQSSAYTSNKIGNIIEDDNMIWVATEEGSVLKLDTHSKLFQNIKASIDNRHYQGLMKKDGQIWMGYFMGGIDIFSTSNNQKQHFSLADFNIPKKNLTALAKDKDGNVWLANGWDIYMQPNGQHDFVYMPMFGQCYAYDIYQDSEGYIWVATLGKGIFKYNPNDKSVKNYTTATSPGLSTNLVNSISEDYKGQLWFSTDRGGICVYNKSSNTFKSYSLEHGLPDDITSKIIEDQNHLLWFGTKKGLVCFNPMTEEVKTYTKKDGLPSDNFSTHGALISATGKLYMGTMEGLIAFHPNTIPKNQFIPKVYLTQLFLDGEPMYPNSDAGILDKSIPLLESIKLSHDYSNISIGFASLSYTSPSSNTYAYQLEGVDKDWIYTQDNKTASYANLKPGTYIFKVKGSNNDGVWNEDEQTLTIVILPPWWSSNWAYAIYFLLALAIVYFGFKYGITKYRSKNAVKQRIFEIRKEKELYEAKLNFFTEIAHEVRTPVSLISAPLDTIIDEKIDNEKVNNALNIIKKNTNILLGLTNQLLDFRKIDSERFDLKTTNIDSIAMIESIISRFEQEIEVSKLSLNFIKNGHKQLYLNSDKEALEKIINNLLSNAIKYGSNNIILSIKEENEYFKFAISNDGKLISAEDKENLFEPFFRAKDAQSDIPGTGLGLSMAKSLAEMLSGFLYYNNENEQNNFFLEIPLSHADNTISTDTHEEEATNQDLKKADITSHVLQEFLVANDSKKSVLLVEDNPDMLAFLSSELSSYFHIDAVNNGEQAITILEEKNFDIILSDIMMPKVNGLELASYIKNEDRFKHIILILLTARNNTDSKIQALQIGVDAYVEKPFTVKYLVSLIESLERNRQTLIDNFSKDLSLGKRKSNLNKNELAFLDKIIKAINTNIADPNFNVEKLAEILNYSRSSLHRRTKAIVDLSPIDLIRMTRLQKAVDLIKQGEYRTNEIAIQVGINSSSYFVKQFQAQYNMTPQEYMESLKNKS